MPYLSSLPGFPKENWLKVAYVVSALVNPSKPLYSGTNFNLRASLYLSTVTPVRSSAVACSWVTSILGSKGLWTRDEPLVSNSSVKNIGLKGDTLGGFKLSITSPIVTNSV